MSALVWARAYVSPPSFTACGHPGYRVHDDECTCNTCGHQWRQDSIQISDSDYDTLLAYVAFRLDSNK